MTKKTNKRSHIYGFNNLKHEVYFLATVFFLTCFDASVAKTCTFHFPFKTKSAVPKWYQISTCWKTITQQSATRSSLSFLEICLQKRNKVVQKCEFIYVENKGLFPTVFFFLPLSGWRAFWNEAPHKKSQHSDDLFACPVYWNQNCQVFIC